MSDDDFNCIEFLQQEKAHVIRRGFPGLAEGFDKCIENLQQLAAAKRDATLGRMIREIVDDPVELRIHPWPAHGTYEVNKYEATTLDEAVRKCFIAEPDSSAIEAAGEGE